MALRNPSKWPPPLQEADKTGRNQTCPVRCHFIKEEGRKEGRENEAGEESVREGEHQGWCCQLHKTRITWKMGLWAYLWGILFITLIDIGRSILIPQAGNPGLDKMENKLDIGLNFSPFPDCGYDVAAASSSCCLDFPSMMVSP